MKILLDHDLPKQLRLEFQGHLVLTARQMGWDALSNGRLLAASEAQDFDLLITADQSMYAQQNHQDRKIGLLVVTSNNLASLRAALPSVLDAIARAESGSYEVVRIPRVKE